MRIRSVYILTALLWVAGLSGGCGRSVAVTEDSPVIEHGGYDRAFDATVEVLRDMRFVVDRRDRRFGVITTRPLIASSIFEPWYDDNTTLRQTVRSTLNLERRSVRVELEPREARPDGLDDSEGSAEDVDAPPAETHDLRVTVSVDRRHHPPLELTSAAFGAVQSSPLRTEAGLLESRWQPIGRDEPLEQRLARAILRRAGHNQHTRP